MFVSRRVSLPDDVCVDDEDALGILPIRQDPLPPAGGAVVGVASVLVVSVLQIALMCATVGLFFIVPAFLCTLLVLSASGGGGGGGGGVEDDTVGGRRVGSSLEGMYRYFFFLATFLHPPVLLAFYALQVYM